MTDEATYDALASIIFLAFAVGLFLSFASIAVRVGRWRVRHREGPLLLYRDLVTFGGLAVSFLAIATARAINLPPAYTRTIPWLLFTSLPALIGVAVFLYFEWFVIGYGRYPIEGDIDG